MDQAKYWRLQMKGELSNEEVEAALRNRAATLLRVDREKGETRIYFSSAEEATKIPKGQAPQEQAQEVSLEEVTKIG
jgi:hypothetical protein